MSEESKTPDPGAAESPPDDAAPPEPAAPAELPEAELVDPSAPLESLAAETGGGLARSASGLRDALAQRPLHLVPELSLRLRRRAGLRHPGEAYNPTSRRGIGVLAGECGRHGSSRIRGQHTHRLRYTAGLSQPPC